MLHGYQFMSDDNRTAITKPDEVATALRCASAEEAQTFACKFPASNCDCQVVEEVVDCRCENFKPSKLLGHELKQLPTKTAGIELQSNAGVISTKIEITTVQIQVTMHQLSLSMEVTNNFCNIEVEAFQGCLDCIRGARLAFQCKTDFEKTLALIKCGMNERVHGKLRSGRTQQRRKKKKKKRCSTSRRYTNNAQCLFVCLFNIGLRKKS
jgi:hypothetical protein